MSWSCVSLRPVLRRSGYHPAPNLRQRRVLITATGTTFKRQYQSPSSGQNAGIKNGPVDMIQANPLKQAFTRLAGGGGGPPALGLWQMLPGANVSRVLARTPGINWVLVDCEHGQIDDTAMHEAVPIIAAEGVSPIVRIPDFQSWMVKRALDSGAHGILAPLIRSVDDVKEFVEACKFPPEGRRGFGSLLPMHGFRVQTQAQTQAQAQRRHPVPVPTLTEYLDQANASILTLVQIETREALDAVEAIAPLVDALFVGPFDLANNLGEPIRDGVFPPSIRDATSRVLAAATAAGRCCGVYAASAEQAAAYSREGFHMVNVATDISLLQAQTAAAVEVARS